MLGLINAAATVLAMGTFAGIVWWAWSAHRAGPNREASEVPFLLPEEYQEPGLQEGRDE